MHRLAFGICSILLSVGWAAAQPIPFSSPKVFASFGEVEKTLGTSNLLLESGKLRVFEMLLPDNEISKAASLASPSSGVLFEVNRSYRYFPLGLYGKVLSASVLQDVLSSKGTIIKVDWHRTNLVVSAGYDFDMVHFFSLVDSRIDGIGGYITRGETAESVSYGIPLLLKQGENTYIFYQYIQYGDGPMVGKTTLLEISFSPNSNGGDRQIDLRFQSDEKSSKVSRSGESRILYSLNDTKVNLRNEPTLGKNIVSVLSGTELFQITDLRPELEKVGEYSGYWTKIKLVDGSEGWILSSFVTKRKE